MEKVFNTLIDSYIKNNIGIADDFLSQDLSMHLKENLKALYAKQLLVTAGTGQNTDFEQNDLLRSDKIYWLDRKHNNIHENSFFDLMDTFIEYLNATCYTGIHNCEFHYTLYEKGSFYKTHLDQFRNNDSRQFSMIMYLNDEWKLKDGGELCIHDDDRMHNISPTNGKSVFFKSNELKHEVLLTNKPRLSITGWLKS
ncbi:MAG TPA: 2OG-Fe(II) oxygenase [Bacteroidia bacterium]|nr:2OG-Fe(II) oxygenase [Bacteroidia bacterium]